MIPPQTTRRGSRMTWHREFWQAFNDPLLRFFFMWGGRNGGRSHAVSRWIALQATKKRQRVLCVRWNLVSSTESMKTDIRNGLAEAGALHLWKTPTSGNFTCANGSVIMFAGLFGSKGLRSLTDIDLVWAEEAQYIRNPEWRDFTYTFLRKPGLKLYVTGNAQFDFDPVYEWCQERKDLPHATWLYTNYKTNWRHLTPDERDEIARAKATMPDVYDNDWLGHPLHQTHPCLLYTSPSPRDS